MLVYDSSINYKATDYVTFTCDVCGCDGIKRYDHIINGIGCPVCSNKKIVPGINDLWTLRPDVASLLCDRDDGYKLTVNSHCKKDFQCPECRKISTHRIADISKRGFNCSFCSVGISYPNRVMRALLDSMNVEYRAEASFEWSNGKRYDFYIRPNTIIEMHGEQHYRGFTGHSFTPFQNILTNDINKLRRAFANGIIHYVTIDSSRSDIDYIANSIMKSRFHKLYDVSNVNWGLIDKVARKSYYGMIVSEFLSGKNAVEISKDCHLDSSIVRNTLRTASKNGDCHYDARSELLNAALHNCAVAHENNKKPVRCKTTGMEFGSLNEAGAYYGIDPNSISSCLTGRSKSSGQIDGVKLRWEYIGGQ